MELSAPASPSRDILQRSQLYFRERICNSILQQERLHALSKKPRRTRFVHEATSNIKRVAERIVPIRKRVLELHSEVRSLEGKVNRLDVIKEQACFFMTPKRVLSEPVVKKSPLKLSFFDSNQSCGSDEGFISGGDCSPSPFNGIPCASPTPTKLVEYLRRRKLVALNVSKISTRLTNEKELLQEIFASNITTLRNKRAEKCLIKMIALQSKLKGIEKELEGVEERLFLEDSLSDEDSRYLSV